MLPGKFSSATTLERGQAIVTTYGISGKDRTYLLDASGRVRVEPQYYEALRRARQLIRTIPLWTRMRLPAPL